MEKSKTRFTSLDVRGVVWELEKVENIVGSHLQNIYDINSRTFLLKFTKKDLKALVLIESGVRIHKTDYDRENPNVTPSMFAIKLRKHLRERRLTKFKQLGFDRVIHLEFGHDAKPEMTFHLFVELYSLGNIILTDHTLKVISLLRKVIVKEKDTGLETKLLDVGMTYQMDSYQTLLPVPPSFKIQQGQYSNEATAKGLLKTHFPLLSPAMVDCSLRIAKIDAKCKSLTQTQTDSLIEASQQVITTVNNFDTFKGTITESAGSWIDFNPVLLLSDDAQTDIVNNQQILFDSFNKSIDEYYHRLEEGQRVERQKQQESTLSKKFKAIKLEQEARIKALEETMDLCLHKAQTIETNVKLVEDAILVINTGLKNDMSWNDLEGLVRLEKERGRATALLIEKLKLSKALIELKLPNLAQSETLLVDVDIRLGAHANANRYYELKKAALDKLERTKAAFAQAMKSAETKVRADARKEKRPIQHLIAKRKTLWFEKFNWFISSDSYLVISGKDMHQNEYLVKRLLKAGDVYVHADISGASSVIVKNHRKADEGAERNNNNNNGQSSPAISHRTLLEAGAFSLCFSKAWEAKIVTSAWWVHAEQVSKTAPSGEYLGTGSFIIRGKKNFLPPAQLALSFGFMFVLDEASSARKKALRIQKESQRDELDKDNTGIATNLLELDFNERESKYGELVGVDDTSTSIVTGQVEKEQSKKNSASKLSTKNSSITTESPDVAKSSTIKEPTSKGPVRGKHGQKQKQKQKYKHQDEEERQLRMQLLGSKPKQQSPLPSNKKAQKEELAKKPVTTTPTAVPAKVVTTPPKEAEATNDHIKQQEKEQIEEEEESVGDLGELAVIDSLTGSPSADDVLIGVLAVAAPLMTLQHYKYRAKLLPGALKRGTAAKTAINLILAENKATISQLEKQLIRSVPDAELNSTMPGKVRVIGSGVELSKLKKAKNKK